MKSIIIPILLGLTLSLLMVNGASSEFIKTSKSSNNQYEIDYQSSEKINGLEGLVKHSDIIVKAKLESKVQKSEDGLYVYQFSPVNFISGSIPEGQFNVYERGYENDNDPLFQEGKEYYLFLESWDDEYYSSTIYTSAIKNSFVKIDDDGKLKLNEKLFGGKISTEKDLTNGIKNYLVSTNKVKKNKRIVKNKAKDINELTQYSEDVVILKPIEVINEAINVKLVKAIVTEKIKGELQNEITVLLPNSASINQEYLIFGKQIDGTLRLSTREDSFYTKGTSSYEEIYKKIKGK